MKTTKQVHLETLKILSGLYQRLSAQAYARALICTTAAALSWFAESDRLADKAIALRKASAVQS